jgi:hypothetical protein
MTMKYALVAAFAMATGAGLSASDPVLTGDYVEARTAEVFTGGCIMGSEGEVSGREALMAWRVRRGSLNGVALDGLSAVALVAADVNLGIHEVGGPSPTTINTVLMVDAKATAEQQQALAQLARTLAPDHLRNVISTTATPIAFDTRATGVHVAAGKASLDVATNVEHSPACGALKWFDPLASVDDAEVGLTRTFEWSGPGLGSHWKQIDRRSSFVGSFTIRR